MSIVTNKRGDIFEQFLQLEEDEVNSLSLDFPITHALVVAKHNHKYLLMFNKWRNNFEVAGGILEGGESLRECALRELKEETNQEPAGMRFLGLMKFLLHNGKTEYGGLYAAHIEKTIDFQQNEEAERIVWWDGRSDIGYIDEIDRKLLEFYAE